MSLTRREFVNITSAIGAGLMTNATAVLARAREQGYRLMVLATNWGFKGTWVEFAERIKAEGYDGAELWYPQDAAERTEVLNLFRERNLSLGFLIGSQEADYRRHYNEFQKTLEAAASERPVYINCHSGRDYFSFEQNASLIRLTTAVSTATGVPVYHETHRSRMLFASPVAREYLEKFPDLRITLDISHWCNVSESLLADQAETVELALSRAGHIHARIGHPEGPQVSDPRAPEWHKAAETHFGWWSIVVERHKAGGKLLTMLTEFGPEDYMPALPYTRKPVADQWEINKYMLDTLRRRYA